MAKTINEVLRRRAKKILSAFDMADRMNVMGKVVFLHIMLYCVPASFFLTLVKFEFEDIFVRYNIDEEFFGQVFMLFIMSAYFLFLDKMIVFAIKFLQSLKRVDSR